MGNEQLGHSIKVCIRACRITHVINTISASQLHFLTNIRMLNWLFAASKLHKHRGTCCTAEWPYCPVAIYTLLIFINLNFDFLVLYKMYFQNSFANRSIKWKSNFTSHLQHSHLCCVRYKIYNSHLRPEFVYADTTRSLMS